jgi:hypothetical protein
VCIAESAVIVIFNVNDEISVDIYVNYRTRRVIYRKCQGGKCQTWSYRLNSRRGRQIEKWVHEIVKFITGLVEEDKC